MVNPRLVALYEALWNFFEFEWLEDGKELEADAIISAFAQTEMAEKLKITDEEMAVLRQAAFNNAAYIADLIRSRVCDGSVMSTEETAERLFVGWLEQWDDAGMPVPNSPKEIIEYCRQTAADLSGGDEEVASCLSVQIIVMLGMKMTSGGVADKTRRLN